MEILYFRSEEGVASSYQGAAAGHSFHSVDAPRREPRSAKSCPSKERVGNGVRSRLIPAVAARVEHPRPVSDKAIFRQLRKAAKSFILTMLAPECAIFVIFC
jgi:hypothetical protein